MSKNFIREWRKHRGMTQVDLQRATGITRSYIAEIERGERPYNEKIAEKISAALECAPSDLLFRDPEMGESIDSMLATFAEPERSRLVALIRTILKPPE